MKNFIFGAIFLFISASLFAQVYPDKYFIAFTDKNNSPYSIDNPSEYLSQRAIDRRVRQNIPVDMKDLPVNPSYVQGVLEIGVELINKTKWLNGITIETDDPSKIDQINDLPYVKSVLKSTPAPGLHDDKPFFENESYTGNEGAMNYAGASRSFNYGPSFNQIDMLNGIELHEEGYRGQGMVIAILDAGFTNTNTISAFDSLWVNGQVLGTWDFVRGMPVTYDQHGHGTAVLSTIGANYPGQLIGTAPLASFWLLRSEDAETEYIIEEYNWVSAAEFADSVGADVINSSLGYTQFDDPSQNHVYDDMDGNTTPVSIGADVAASRGMIVCSSAGNSGASSWFYLSAPSDGDSVVGVGAVDANGNYASFSSRGPSADGQIKPNVAAKGQDAWIGYTNGQFGGGNGTSFASPIMAGMITCLWQANQSLTNMEIIAAVQQSGNQYTNPDDKLGYGIPDFMLANSILTIIETPAGSLSEIARVYPNPFKENITVDLNNTAAGKAIIELYDYTGRLISNSEHAVSENGILILSDLGGLADGFYNLRVIIDDKSYSQKLLKF